MIHASLATLQALEKGLALQYKVTIYFQQPEIYTFDDLLRSVGDPSQSLSSDGGYEIGNTTIVLDNKDYYFSRKFAKELPNNKLVELHMQAGDESILLFRGVVANGWTLTQTELTLQVNA